MRHYMLAAMTLANIEAERRALTREPEPEPTSEGVSAPAAPAEPSVAAQRRVTVIGVNGDPNPPPIWGGPRPPAPKYTAKRGGTEADAARQRAAAEKRARKAAKRQGE